MDKKTGSVVAVKKIFGKLLFIFLDFVFTCGSQAADWIVT